MYTGSILSISLLPFLFLQIRKAIISRTRIITLKRIGMRGEELLLSLLVVALGNGVSGLSESEGLTCLGGFG